MTRLDLMLASAADIFGACRISERTTYHARVEELRRRLNRRMR